MTDFDVQQVREAVESRTRQMGYLMSHRETDAALAVIVPAVTEQVRAPHRPVHLTFSWRDGVRAEDLCETCGGKAGVHECGCWGEFARAVFCLACSDLSGHTSYRAEYPCPTVRVLDEIESAVKAGER